MNASYDKNTAVVILPRLEPGWLRDKSLRAWLAQSDLGATKASTDLLSRVLEEIGLPNPETGLAALRMWGQTGDRPTKWIAAADPVYLEPQLDQLCLHRFTDGDVKPAELRSLMDHLQRTLSDDQGIGFTRLAHFGYLSSTGPIATAKVPADVVDQCNPESFLPAEEDKATHRRLIGEIEMALHEHEVNLQREAQGKKTINSLWLWGGGVAPAESVQAQPPLFSDDPLLTGYWYAAKAVAEPWLGNIDDCLSLAVGGFVAVLPEAQCDVNVIEKNLAQLRLALRRRRLDHVRLIFGDGLCADVRRTHAMRIWRRDSALLPRQQDV